MSTVLKVCKWKEFLVQTPLYGEKERGNVDEMRVGDHVCTQVPGSTTSWDFPWALDEIVAKVKTRQLTIPNLSRLGCTTEK